MISKEFVTAGKATFTVDNGKGNWYTFKVVYKPANEQFRRESYIVLVLTGPDNQNSYSYVGKLNIKTGEVYLTPGSKFGPDDQHYTVVRWALGKVWHNEELPPGYKLHHMNQCGRCGHPLTTPLSIERAIGPECWAAMGLDG
jgi:hypothetical protein